MKKKKIFKEKNTFQDRILISALSVGILVSLYGLVKTIIASHFDVYHAFTFVAIALFFGVLIKAISLLELKVSLTKDCIKYKMIPFHQKSRCIPWEDVASVKVVRTPLVAQFHGGNISFSSEIWMSLTGRNGLSVLTKDGKKYFLGCRNLDELENSLSKLNF